MSCGWCRSYEKQIALLKAQIEKMNTISAVVSEKDSNINSLKEQSHVDRIRYLEETNNLLKEKISFLQEKMQFLQEKSK